MIKRRFYRQEHGDRDGAASDSSESSSSDSDSPPQKEEGRGGDEDEAAEEVEEEEKERSLSPLPESGYDSEDSSGHEFGCDSSGLIINNDEEGESSEGGSHPRKYSRLISEDHVEETRIPSKPVAKASSAKDSIPDLDSCILKYKSVFKCRLCPRIVCLSETTVRAHLNSKRHARSKKLLEEGRLKLTLNSDGEVEEDQETHAERHARTVALAKEKDAPIKTDEPQRRQKRNRKQKLRNGSDNGGRSEKTNKRLKKK